MWKTSKSWNKAWIKPCVSCLLRATASEMSNCVNIQRVLWAIKLFKMSNVVQYDTIKTFWCVPGSTFEVWHLNRSYEDKTVPQPSSVTQWQRVRWVSFLSVLPRHPAFVPPPTSCQKSTDRKGGGLSFSYLLNKELFKLLSSSSSLTSVQVMGGNRGDFLRELNSADRF